LLITHAARKCFGLAFAHIQSEFSLLRVGMHRLQLDPTPPCTLVTDFLSLLHSKRYADMMLEIGPVSCRECMAAHSAIVAARSPWLRARVMATLAPQRTPQMHANAALPIVPLDIEDVDAFKIVLHFMYSDRLADVLTAPNLEPGSMEVSTSIACATQTLTHACAAAASHAYPCRSVRCAVSPAAEHSLRHGLRLTCD
jgi:hypothetical protein